ncbi:hypothetical protein CBR_g37734 [Chara braunii]|uniref:Uncharacterized protein n=1 Tax=Chara braunii TaxID=69332 RepID=A0A388K035_CHABU|nr:hypothetical protein CBR_g37734 [Chara braunii]|eukprot:GBG63376.1 hypothetical protein CBR_g37734 [Chara braunii]
MFTPVSAVLLALSRRQPNQQMPALSLQELITAARSHCGGQKVELTRSIQECLDKQLIPNQIVVCRMGRYSLTDDGERKLQHMLRCTWDEEAIMPGLKSPPPPPQSRNSQARGGGRK